MRKLIFCISFLTCLFYSSLSQAPFSATGHDISVNFGFTKQGSLRLMTILPDSYNKVNPETPSYDRDEEVFLHITGEDRNEHHGAKLTGASASERLEFVKKTESKIPGGSILTIEQHDPVKNLKVESVYEFNDLSPVIRRYTILTNQGAENVGIEYLSSAILNNYSNITDGSPQENLLIHYAYNSWKQEAQWKCNKPSEMGWEENGAFNINGLFFTNTGSWSTVKYLPMGMIENTRAGITWFWQIEHNGSWHYEMSTYSNPGTYLYLGGPDEEHHHAWKNLKPGESYRTVPAALGCVKGGMNEAVEALTVYRRKVLLKDHAENSACPVIFNDYMNCLDGDPTTEKELPLIDAAAKAGCEYFVIDAGWYAERNENWWDAVGLWQPSKTRFPGGLTDLLTKIRNKGMKPGLWLEIEVAGVNSPLKNKPDSWFMMRHGQRIIDHGRYLLDFRNPEVIAHANEVVDRLAGQYGASYIKMDYNITAIMGTETDADSYGQGLLEHNRALTEWYRRVHERHPDLVIENCGSGGCRMDYAMLGQTQIQSSSDQTDYRKYPAIVVGALAAVIPEQLAVWSYPLQDGNAREASFNMVNAMLCRIHQSGHLANLPKESLSEVTDGIRVYRKSIAPYISESVPFFPLGMPSIYDRQSPVSAGLKNGNKKFIAVWRLEGSERVVIPGLAEGELMLLYPTDLGIKVAKSGKDISVIFPGRYMAAIVGVVQ
ncbi:MAG TPA: alpha-galactosidase [Bacteroidales bacterium]|nr:alpha-galactosidase [Bacteroidales bacterium]